MASFLVYSLPDTERLLSEQMFGTLLLNLNVNLYSLLRSSVVETGCLLSGRDWLQLDGQKLIYVSGLVGWMINIKTCSCLFPLVDGAITVLIN